MGLLFYALDGFRNLHQAFESALKAIFKDSKKWGISKGSITKARDRIPKEVFKQAWKILVEQSNKTFRRTRPKRRIKCLDGTIFYTPDTKENEENFGKPFSSRGKTAFPQIRAVLLMDAQTRIFEAIEWGHCQNDSELKLADRLIEKTNLEGVLLEGDRLYFSKERCYTVLEKKADFLFRLSKNVKIYTCITLNDGTIVGLVFMKNESKKLKQKMTEKYASYSLPRLQLEQKTLLKNIRKRKKEEKPGHVRSRHKTPRCFLVRLIEYTVTVHSTELPKRTQLYRLATSILDPDDLSAEEAIHNYHLRWGEEVGIRELKWLQRFHKPHFSAMRAERVLQELFLLLLLHTLIRCFILETSIQSKESVARFSVSYVCHLVRNVLIKTPFSRKNRHPCSEDDFFQQISRNRLSKLFPRECPRALKVVVGRYPSKSRSRGPPSYKVSYEICLQ